MSDGTHGGKPDHVALSELITGQGADVFWLPECRTDEQRTARAALTLALHGYERAYGIDSTLQQLRMFIASAVVLTRKNAAMDRVQAARADINLEAHRARREGKEALAREIEAQPTPDYPGKADDDRELGYDN